jgi:hypothetical protein
MNLRYALEDREKAQQRIEKATARLRVLAAQAEALGAGGLSEQLAGWLAKIDDKGLGQCPVPAQDGDGPDAA